jgi:hypothetical protein
MRRAATGILRSPYGLPSDAGRPNHLHLTFNRCVTVDVALARKTGCRLTGVVSLGHRDTATVSRYAGTVW